MFVSKKPNGASSKIPPYFLCPISQELMEDPTITQCGHMFDRVNIVEYLHEPANKLGCPLCQQKISEASLAPCFPLKAAISEFKSKKSNDALNDAGKLMSTINRKIGNLVFKNGDVKDESSSRPTQAGSTAVKKRPKAETAVGVAPPTYSRKTAPQHLSDGALSDNEKSKSTNRTVGSNKSPSTTNSKKESGKPWATLIPILDTSEAIDLIVDEYSFGRGSSCDKIFDASEISSVHCSIYRVLKDDNHWEYYVEDKSTNGTYLNGSRVGKGLVSSLAHDDEISMGERFSTKIIPKVPGFVDWVFSKEEGVTPERKVEIEKTKVVPTFYEFLAMDDTAFRNIGIRSEFVRSKLITASKNWRDKYRFPAFRFELHTQIKKSKHSSRAIEGNPSEINFDPAEYIERDSAGVICMTVRRSGGLRGQLSVTVKSSPKSKTKPGLIYTDFEKHHTFIEGEQEWTVEFFWKAEQLTTTNASIVFELLVASGNGKVGRQGEASCTIEVGRAKPKSVDSPAWMDLQKRVSNNVQPPSVKEEDSRNQQRDVNQRNMDDEILALMMDSFPTIDAKVIIDIIRQERQMIGPINDAQLLRDMVAVKLTNFNRKGKELDINGVNIQVRGAKDDVPNKVVDQLMASPPIALPAPPSVAILPPQQPVDPSAVKFKQTILLAELESFLLMASISLVRKFFNIQGIDCNVTHFQSPIVSLSCGLTESFMKTLDTIAPIETGLQKEQDVYDFDVIVEMFKKYVYNQGSKLRAKALPLEPAQIATAYRYDIAFHKSAHHLKMENNHAIVEDLNTFAKIKKGPLASFYGVFDGHGGYMISEYLSLHLAAIIARQPAFLTNIPEAIRTGYAEADQSVLKKIQRDKLKGGSTCVTAIIRDGYVHVAWAGDARCIIFRRMGGNLIAVPLVNPHNPQGAEKTRIVQMGGFVEFIAGKWRVNGRLAVTRSFGDESLKHVVTAEPEMAKFQLTGDEEFLMMSCDGLYDVMEYSDIAEYLDECIKKGMKLGKLAAALVQEGVTRKSTDDITVMLINLGRNSNL